MSTIKECEGACLSQWSTPPPPFRQRESRAVLCSGRRGAKAVPGRYEHPLSPAMFICAVLAWWSR
eukprot:863656-Alexandrium_andersonii.AAC.1